MRIARHKTRRLFSPFRRAQERERESCPAPIWHLGPSRAKNDRTGPDIRLFASNLSPPCGGPLASGRSVARDGHGKTIRQRRQCGSGYTARQLASPDRRTARHRRSAAAEIVGPQGGLRPQPGPSPKGQWAHLRPLAARSYPQAFGSRYPRPQEDTGGRRIAEDAAEKPATETAEARHRSQWRPTAGGPADDSQAGTANAAAPPYRGEGCGSLRRAP